MFPIYEVFDGEDYVINIEPEGRPVSQYLSLQGRFSHVTELDIEEIQARIDCDWERLPA